MTTVRVDHRVDAAGLAELRVPRDDLVSESVDESVGESADGTSASRFDLLEGPFETYQRTLDVEADGESHFRVTETFTYREAVPFWRFATHYPIKWSIARRRPGGGQPWWAPPQRLDTRAARVLTILCTLSVFAGYMGSVLSQTISFASDEFAISEATQGSATALVRAGVLISLVVTTLADRRGRRMLLLGSAMLAAMLTATGALVPGIWWLALSQGSARAISTSLGILIGIVAAEELPAGSRAYGISIMAMLAGLGSGMVLWVLPFVGAESGGWRVIYVIPLVFIPLISMAGRQLPETKRFERSDPAQGPTDAQRKLAYQRLAMLAIGGFFFTIFSTPASNFRVDFLKDELGFNPGEISIFQFVTNTPIGIGVFAAGKLADLYGRRIIASVAIVGGVLFTALSYALTGASIWVFAGLGSVIGAMAVPALGVYGPELFSTRERGRMNGIITVVSVVGSAIGLIAVGFLKDRWGSFGPAFLAVSAGPVVLLVLIALFYPETAKTELEDINPRDRS